MIASLLALLAAAANPVSAFAAPLPDVDAPIIEDVAAAASNPAAAPVVTVLMSDGGSGVGKAAVVYRASGKDPWTSADLRGGSSGLFIARLPDGLQGTGFDYYVEASDVAGNGPARIGSPEAPIHVEKAGKPTLVRIEEQHFQEPGPSIHPAWLMLSLGVGVLASAGAGAYAIDLGGVNTRLSDTNDALARTDLSDAQRARLEIRQAGFETAAVQDTTIAVVLGVVGAAGIVTGVTLVIISSLE